MMKSCVSGLLLLSVSVLIGCGNKYDSGVQKAVTDNKEAKNLMEWKLSEGNPETLFAQWREDFKKNPSEQDKMKSELCTALHSLDGVALTIFEEELRRKSNAPLVTSCKNELLSKLDIFFSKERETLPVAVDANSTQPSPNNFRFSDNVQKRDTSKGYYASYGDVARKEIVLTFDDGPTGVYTESILRSLREVNAKAIFFQLGKNASLNPGIVRKVAADGHAIGSHSIGHKCLGTSAACRRNNGYNLSFDEAVAEIKGGHQAIYDILGWVDPFFRFPYAEGSPELRQFLKANSTAEFAWVIDSEDWRGQSNENLLRNTLAQVDAKGRGIVLFHDIQRRTAEIMPQFLRELYMRGFSVVLLQSADPNARYNSKLVRKRSNPLP
ncbi:polysaccharide deacetylase family protein [Bdellovibrio sp. 22V]|uniref:polysaccharide deacetylase family protein n=1 Tax=Bdellovibrio TaxID=958 RepID=UPI00254397C4|nr:polysaccharide deacetylase family protein [Bdellovibrio sp. 22V]WII73164.1 polysaccharide deacetylase family protein [Bdellovibrio sp. 22V]